MGFWVYGWPALIAPAFFYFPGGVDIRRRMTKTAKIILFGLAGFLVYRLYKKGEALGKLALSINNIGFQVEKTGIWVTLFINTVNRESANVLINSLFGDIYFNGDRLGNFKNESQIFIPGNGSLIIPIQVFVLYQGIGNVLASVLTGELKQRADFSIDGSANVEGINFPLSLNYSLL